MNCPWGNLNDPDVEIDRESDRNSRLPRQNYLRAAETFMMRGDKEKAIALLDRCLEYFPDSKIQFDMLMIPFAEMYYSSENIEKGNFVAGRLIEIYADDLRYYGSLKPSFVNRYYKESADRMVRLLRNLSQMTRDYEQEDLALKADDAISKFSGKQ
jgi:hypothetical protein